MRSDRENKDSVLSQTLISNLSSVSTTSMGMGRSAGDPETSPAMSDRNGLKPAQQAITVSVASRYTIFPDSMCRTSSW